MGASYLYRSYCIFSFVPESTRWQVSANKTEKAKKEIRRASVTNEASITEAAIETVCTLSYIKKYQYEYLVFLKLYSSAKQKCTDFSLFLRQLLYDFSTILTVEYSTIKSYYFV